MTDLASLAVAMTTSQTRTEASLAFLRQNADFQRQSVLALVETAAAAPQAPEGMGKIVDQYA
ncbi:putative motility protein [Zavarzinia compransoris]|nr:YjfB family protein [Zavarzinia compransoris]TDP43516.1 putative motility protein YjfB-like [Zavarzinia compransoris]